MTDHYQEKVYKQILSFIKRQDWDFSEKDEFGTKRFDIHHVKAKCIVKVYSNGTILIQGQESKLREAMLQLKQAIENDEVIASELLPFEIEDFPETLQKNIPNIDPVIVRFLSEAILCMKANSLLGCSFLLGAASEKAIRLLIDAYVKAMQDDSARNKISTRVNNRLISIAYAEFRQSFRSCKSKPANSTLAQDLDAKVDSIFQFCRICRNEVGHPQISPNLDKGVLLANMGQFVMYMETIYKLIDYFNNTKIEV
ncbi:hypothetical protein ES708_26995 [subsurface metagenome]